MNTELSKEKLVNLTMHTPPPSLAEINDFLQNELTTNRYPGSEQGGIYHPSGRPVKQLGLSLEPFSGLPAWVDEHHIDALWLHRPWRLDLATLPSNIGILSHHLPFDETLTIGYNRRLAEQLGSLNTPEPIGYKQANNEAGEVLPLRPIGMLIDILERDFDALLRRMTTLFGGYDQAEAGPGPTGEQSAGNRIAVIGAMTDTLVREAADKGAHVYLTGAYRKPAQQAVDETGMAVIAVGHRRIEEWGMGILAELLHERWTINCLVHY